MIGIKVKYNDLKEVKGFEGRKDMIEWGMIVDEYMGFTRIKGTITEETDGTAKFTFTDEFVFGAKERPKPLTDERMTDIVRRTLEEKFEKNNINYNSIV